MCWELPCPRDCRILQQATYTWQTSYCTPLTFGQPHRHHPWSNYLSQLPCASFSDVSNSPISLCAWLIAAPQLYSSSTVEKPKIDEYTPTDPCYSVEQTHADMNSIRSASLRCKILGSWISNIFLSHLHLGIVDAPCFSITTKPHLDSEFFGLSGHVLNEAASTFERPQMLMDC